MEIEIASELELVRNGRWSLDLDFYFDLKLPPVCVCVFACMLVLSTWPIITTMPDR